MLVYGTLIKVIAGFYMGCVGNITESSVYVGDYKANVSCKYKDGNGHKNVNNVEISINEKEVEVIK